MAYTNPDKITPFFAGQQLSARKLEALRYAATGTSRLQVTQGVGGPDGFTTDGMFHQDEDLIDAINENPTTIPPFSMFTLKKDTAVSSGIINAPYISADIDNEGLIYYTNGRRGLPQNTPFPCRNITSTYPSRIKYDNENIPVLGEECGPANDGTGRVTSEGFGFVCITLPDTENQTTWIQEIGAGLIGASWIGVIDQVSVPPCGLTPFVAYELTTPNPSDPTGY